MDDVGKKGSSAGRLQLRWWEKRRAVNDKILQGPLQQEARREE